MDQRNNRYDFFPEENSSSSSQTIDNPEKQIILEEDKVEGDLNLQFGADIVGDQAEDNEASEVNQFNMKKNAKKGKKMKKVRKKLLKNLQNEEMENDQIDNASIHSVPLNLQVQQEISMQDVSMVDGIQNRGFHERDRIFFQQNELINSQEENKFIELGILSPNQHSMHTLIEREPQEMTASKNMNSVINTSDNLTENLNSESVNDLERMSRLTSKGKDSMIVNLKSVFNQNQGYDGVSESTPISFGLNNSEKNKLSLTNSVGSEIRQSVATKNLLNLPNLQVIDEKDKDENNNDKIIDKLRPSLYKATIKELFKHHLFDQIVRRILKVTIVRAIFLEDNTDTFGSQDPFIQFKFEDQLYRTISIPEGGKLGLWRESFYFPSFMNLLKEYRQERNSSSKYKLQFEAYDEDVTDHDFIGVTEEIPFFKVYSIMQDNGFYQGQEVKLPLYNNFNRLVGNIWVQFDLEPEIPKDYAPKISENFGVRPPMQKSLEVFGEKQDLPTEEEQKVMGRSSESQSIFKKRRKKKTNQNSLVTSDSQPVSSNVLSESRHNNLQINTNALVIEEEKPNNKTFSSLERGSQSERISRGKQTARIQNLLRDTIQSEQENTQIIIQQDVFVDQLDQTPITVTDNQHLCRNCKGNVKSDQQDTKSYRNFAGAPIINKNNKQAQENPKGELGGIGGGQNEEEEIQFEPLSYKKLIKVIEKNHPVDPVTKEKLDFSERINVKGFGYKLLDVLFIYYMMNKLKIFKKYILAKCGRNQKKKRVKPDSFKDFPSSGSDSDESDDGDNPRAKGLTEASQLIGEGAALYLQSMKTFAVMFGVLTIINFPLFLMFPSTTMGNQYTDINKFFQYFTLGNVATLDTYCDYSKIPIYDLDKSKKEINLQCPSGSYINEITNFGLLYMYDKRIDGNSTGESFCYASNNPTKKPQRFKDPDFQVQEKSRYLKSVDGVYSRYLSQSEKNSELINSLRFLEIATESETSEQLTVNSTEIQQNEQDQSINSNITNEESEKTNDQIEMVDIGCEECIEQGNKLCISNQFISSPLSYCCDPHNNSSDCTNPSSLYSCYTKESLQNEANQSYQLFLKGICPKMSNNCVSTAKEINAFKSNFRAVRRTKPQSLLKTAEFCSYWITPPIDMLEGDFIEISVLKQINTKISAMVVHDDINGSLHYMDQYSLTFNKNEAFQFNLKDLQDIEDYKFQQKQQELFDQEIYEKIPRDIPLSLLNGYSTSYSILLIVESTDPNKEGDFLINIFANKTLSDKPLGKRVETPQQKEARLSKLPVYLEIKKYKEQEKELNTETQGKTDFNIDSQCQYSEDYDESTSLFKSEQYNTYFTSYFDEVCRYKQNCTIDPNIRLNPYNENEFNFENFQQPLELTKKLSSHCIERIVTKNITSQHFIIIVGCKEDFVTIFNFSINKEYLGVWVVGLDILSIFIMAFFFIKLEAINQEYLDIIDNMYVQMSDFTIQINDLKVDKYSQDQRVLKLKLWMHFTDLLREHRNYENNMEIVDITLTLYTLPTIQLVFKMQDVTEEMNQIQNKIYAGVFQNMQARAKMEEVKALKGKLEKLKEKYKEMTTKKDKCKTVIEKLPRSQRINSIQYVFVIFRNNQTVDTVLDIYKEDTLFVKIFKKIFMFRSIKVHQILFQHHEMKIKQALEPDEIIWENLNYSEDQQAIRKIGMQVVSVIFLILATILTIYIEGSGDFLDEKIPEPECPDYIEAYTDPDSLPYQELVLRDYYSPVEDQDLLMECFCSRHSSWWEPWKMFYYGFQEARKVLDQGQGNRYYCFEVRMLWLLKIITNFFIATSAVFINDFIASTFTYLTELTKQHTKIQQQSMGFKQIFVLEFTNMALIRLVTSLSIFAYVSQVLPGPKKSFDDFDPDWYSERGNDICIFLFTSIFITNSEELVGYLNVLLKRCWDRSFKLSLKKDPEDPEDDEPNTKKKIQSELEELYIGDEFKGDEAFSRMMSTLFVMIMYSSGMPLLYPMAMLFFAITYLVNKMLIFKYFQTLANLTRTIPLFSIKFLRFGLMIHMILSAFMLTNPIIFSTFVNQNPEPLGFNPVEKINQLREEIGGNQSVWNYFVSRLTFFHQQLYLVFLIGFAVLFVAGHSVYSILEFITISIYNLILNIINFIKNLAKNGVKFIQCLINKEKFEWEYEKRLIIDDSQLNLSEQLEQLEEEIEKQDSSSSENSEVGSQINLLNQEDNFDERYIQKRAKFEIKEANQLRRQKLLEQIEERTRRQEETKKEKPDYSDNFYFELDCENLSNLYERAKMELDDFLDLFNLEPGQEITSLINDQLSNNPMRIVFEEICFVNRITLEQVLKFQKFLKKRIWDIEDVIDHHFELIKDCLILDIKEKFEREAKKRRKEGKEGSLQNQLQRKVEEQEYLKSQRLSMDEYTEYTYEKRLEKLIEKQEALIQKDKARPENREGRQYVCRMTGSMAMSYFIFDSQQFQVARKIYFSLQERKPKEDEKGADLLNAMLQDQDEDEEEGEEEEIEDEFKSRKGKSQKSVR